MDPGFLYTTALVKVSGRAMLRLAEADVLPFDPRTLADTLGTYVDEVKELADELREKTAETNRLIDDGDYAAAADVRDKLRPPKREDPVPHLNFAPLDNAMERLKARVDALEQAFASAVDESGRLPESKATALNALAKDLERAMGRPEGLPGREWYTHLVYAPGFYTGYGVKTLPAVRETIEARRWSEADAGIALTAEVLNQVSDHLDRATKVLEPQTRDD